MAQAFDTLAAAKTLRDAGMEREQAEAVASVMHQAQGDLVTKADLWKALLVQGSAVVALTVALLSLAAT